MERAPGRPPRPHRRGRRPGRLLALWLPLWPSCRRCRVTVFDPTPTQNPATSEAALNAGAARVLRAIRLADALNVDIEDVWLLSRGWDVTFLPVRVEEPLR